MGLPRPYSPPTVDVPHIGGVLVRKMGREASLNRRKNRKGPFQIMEGIDPVRPWSGRAPSERWGHCVGRRGAASRWRVGSRCNRAPLPGAFLAAQNPSAHAELAELHLFEAL